MKAFALLRKQTLTSVGYKNYLCRKTCLIYDFENFPQLHYGVERKNSGSKASQYLDIASTKTLKQCLYSLLYVELVSRLAFMESIHLCKWWRIIRINMYVFIGDHGGWMVTIGICTKRKAVEEKRLDTDF